MNYIIVRISLFIIAIAILIFALSNIYTITVDSQGTAWVLNKITANVYKYYDIQKGFTGYSILQRNKLYTPPR